MNPIRESEEVYEFDGTSTYSDDHLAAFKDILKARLSSGVEKDSVINDGLNAESAFQIFNGKLYFSDSSDHVYSDSVGRRVESPIERLKRLQSELISLESDLNELAKVFQFFCLVRILCHLVVSRTKSLKKLLFGLSFMRRREKW